MVPNKSKLRTLTNKYKWQIEDWSANDIYITVFGDKSIAIVSHNTGKVTHSKAEVLASGAYEPVVPLVPFLKLIQQCLYKHISESKYTESQKY